MSHTLDVAHIISVLGAEITRMVSLDLAVGNLILFGLFECGNLLIGQDYAVFLGFGREGFQALLERRQIVAQPDASYPAL